MEPVPHTVENAEVHDRDGLCDDDEDDVESDEFSVPAGVEGGGGGESSDGLMTVGWCPHVLLILVAVDGEIGPEQADLAVVELLAHEALEL